MAKSIASLLAESECGCKVVDEARSKDLGDGKWEYEGKVGVWRTLGNGDRAFFPDDGGEPLAAARTLKHPSNGGKKTVVDRRTLREGADAVSTGPIPFIKAMKDMAISLAEKHLRSKLGYGAKDEMDVTFSSVDERSDGYVFYLDEQIKGLTLSVYLNVGTYEVRAH